MLGSAHATAFLLALGWPAALAGAQEPAPAPRAEQEAEKKQEPPPAPTPKRAALVVLVNQKNPTTTLTLHQLRAYLKLERTFWPDRTRTKLVLRSSSSEEMKILLEHVYRMTAKELLRYFKDKNFRGEITRAKCISHSATAEDAIAQVRSDPSAITVVMASDLPENLDGVRVLSVEGIRPDQRGYALVGEAKSREKAEEPRDAGDPVSQ